MSELERHSRPAFFSIGEIARVAGCVIGGGAAVTVGGVVTIATSGCGESEELAPPPASETTAAQLNEAQQYSQPTPQPGAVAQQQANAPASAGLTQEQLADILANLSPEQRAALGPNPTPAQIGALIAPPEAGASDDLEDTTLGRINMEAVQAAFEQASDVEDFETRINQIHEGDHLVLIRVRNEQGATITEAWEDLDDSGQVDEQADDLLFSMTLAHQDRTARLEGQGVNSYYSHEYPPQYTPPAAGGFWTGFIVANMVRPNWVYVTPPARRVVIRNNIRAYRATPGWIVHRRNTQAYYNRVALSHPRFRPAVVTVSPARRTFRYARRGHGNFRPGPPPPPHVRIAAPPPPRVHITPPQPPRVHVTAPRPPSVHVHAPPPPRATVTIHGGGR
jgi:hypothetical protein